jgi:hypothetical protein
LAELRSRDAGLHAFSQRFDGRQLHRLLSTSDTARRVTGVNQEVALLTALAASKGIVKSGALELPSARWQETRSLRDARNALAAFAVALPKLGEPVPGDTASAQKGIS